MRAVCDFAGLADAPPLSIERYNLRFGRYVASGNSFDPTAVRYTKLSLRLSNGQESELEALRDAIRSDLRFVRNAAI